MASEKRTFTEGGVYHIYNRGNHRLQTFLSVEDYAHFLIRLHEYAKRDGVEALAYCLMGNHFHLLLRQSTDRSLSRTMMSLGVSYAKYFNWQYAQVGHVYQGRYGARSVMDNADLINAARYIHLNPSTFGQPEEYRWSDLRTHLNGRTQLLELLQISPIQYREFIYEKINTASWQPTSKVS